MGTEGGRRGTLETGKRTERGRERKVEVESGEQRGEGDVAGGDGEGKERMERGRKKGDWWKHGNIMEATRKGRREKERWRLKSEPRRGRGFQMDCDSSRGIIVQWRCDTVGAYLLSQRHDPPPRRPLHSPQRPPPDTIIFASDNAEASSILLGHHDAQKSPAGKKKGNQDVCPVIVATDSIPTPTPSSPTSPPPQLMLGLVQRELTRTNH